MRNRRLGAAARDLAASRIRFRTRKLRLANLDGATNTIPSFITANGPVREARFIRNPDGSLDGGVHGLFTIMGRS